MKYWLVKSELTTWSWEQLRENKLMTQTLAGILMAATLLVGLPAAEVRGAALQFEEHLIMDNYAYPYGIAAGDLDGNGNIDLTSADAIPHNAL